MCLVIYEDEMEKRSDEIQWAKLRGDNITILTDDGLVKTLSDYEDNDDYYYYRED
jgi:hypothetical protein